jgi:dihydroorotase
MNNNSLKTSFDLLLKGGQVIDPANGINRLMDLAIKDKKIALVAERIPTNNALRLIDVSGLIVTPGILDIHTHVYIFRPTTANFVAGVDADAHLFSSGVTTTVDAGTAGWKNFSDFMEWGIHRSKVRILAFLNIAGSGMVNSLSEQDPSEFQPKITAAIAQAFPEIIVGIKSAHYWTEKPWDDVHLPWASVDNAIEAGEMCQKPVMVDFWPRPPERSYSDLILKKLRPDDIHTHVFARQFPIINSQGRLYDYLLSARERGIIFDLGHGAGSFWFRNAVPAFNQDFPPDSISTDFHMGNVNGPVVSMINTMSKFLSMGMDLSEVIERSTVIPAKIINRPDLGTLSTGCDADVAILNRVQGSFGFTDCGKARMLGKEKLECKLTIRAGEIVFDPTGLGMPEWENAPAPYWDIPNYQA